MYKPLYFILLPLLFGLAGCGMAEKNLEEAQNDPIHEFDLGLEITGVELKGDMYYYGFSITNHSKTETFEGAWDVELVLGSKASSHIHNNLSVALPPQQKYIFALDSPVEPGMDGYNWVVFRAYDPMDKLLVREAHEIPAEIQVGS